MAAHPEILVLGVHRLEFDESWVEGHLETLCPPYGPKIRNDVREMLGSAVVMELLVMDRDERFDVSSFQQPVTTRSWSWFSPVGIACVWFLTADGQARLEFDDEDEDDGPLPPMEINTFRVAVYLRGWDETQPLLSSYGELRRPAITAMPERLLRLAPYVSYD
jgi:hypothetical protein